MSSVESFFLDLELSYTLSKVAAYLLFPLLGLLVWLIVKRWIRKRTLKIAALLVLCVGFFFGYFFLHPIYEGDFSNNPTPVQMKSELDDLETQQLVVISIPNCPFCQESIARMRALRERHPEVKIEYRVCVSNSGAAEAVSAYRKMTGKGIAVSQAADERQLAILAEMSFPAFVLVTKSGKKKWSNDDFGAGAMDEVVAAFEK
ncbi:MAG TPA: hypothetical protein VK151_10120 [Fluviicola sp.]|nr:hypothetical protein [Fluviicola sp.]